MLISHKMVVNINRKTSDKCINLLNKIGLNFLKAYGYSDIHIER